MFGLSRPAKSSCDLTLPPSFQSPEWATNQKNVSHGAGHGDSTRNRGWDPPNPNITIYIRLAACPSRKISGHTMAQMGPRSTQRSPESLLGRSIQTFCSARAVKKDVAVDRGACQPLKGCRQHAESVLVRHRHPLQLQLTTYSWFSLCGRPPCYCPGSVIGGGTQGGII